jgi:hypothetical protein
MRKPIHGSLAALSSSNTAYLLFCSTSSTYASDSSVLHRFSAAGTIKNLTATLGATPGSGKNYTLTFTKNGSAQTTTITISDSATTATDTTNSFSVAAGDYVNLKVVPTGTPTATSITFSFDFDTTSSNKDVLFVSGTTNTGFTTQYFPVATDRGETLTILNKKMETVFPHGGTLDALYADSPTAPGVGNSLQFSFYVNGVENASSIVSITGTNTSANITGLSVTIAAGDRVSIRCLANTSMSSRDIGIGSLFSPTTDGNSILASSYSAGGSVSATNYSSWMRRDTAFSASEISLTTGVSHFKIKSIYADVTTAPASGKSFTYTIRKNAGNGTVTAVMSNTAITANDTAHSDDFVTGDTFDFSSVPSGTPTAPGVCTFSATLYCVIPTLELEGFRFRADDGSETTATYLASQDTNITRAKVTNTRLRMLINATDDPYTRQYRLDYKLSTDGAWSYVDQPVSGNTTLTTVGTFAENSSAGNLGWTNISNADVANDTYATSALSGSGGATPQTYYLVATNWSAAVPSNATIVGVVVKIEHKQSASGIRLTELKLVKGGTIQGTDHGVDGTNISTTETEDSYGGAADMWGLALAYSDINASDFGVAFRYRNNNASARTVSVDNITIVVYYTTPGAIMLSASANITASGEATTALLTAPSGKTTSNFVTGRMQDDENPADTVDITTDNYTELEWCIQATSITNDGEIYQFRVTVGGTVLDTYSVDPRMTIGSSSIKTINGLAKVSVKTVNGLAIASLKTWLGLA